MKTPTSNTFVSFEPGKGAKKATLGIIRSHARRKAQVQQFATEKRAKRNNTLQTRFAVAKFTRRSKAENRSHDCWLSKTDATGQEYQSSSGSFREVEASQAAVEAEDTADYQNTDVNITEWRPVSEQIVCDLDGAQLAVIYMVENIWDVWKWGQTKRELITETLANPGMTHSFLAMAHSLWKHDQVRAITHENAAVQYVAQQCDYLGAEADQYCTNYSEHLGLLAWIGIRLALIRVQQGDAEGASAHLKGIMTLTRLGGGFQALSFEQQLRSSLATLVLSYLAIYGSIPDAIRYPFGSWTTCALHEIRALGMQVSPICFFEDSERAKIVSPQLLDVMLALNALCEASEMATSIQGPSPGVAKESLKIALRLVELGSQSANIDQAPFPRFEECLRLTTLLFVWSFTRKVAFFAHNLSACHRKVQRLFAVAEETKRLDQIFPMSVPEDMVLWVLVVLGSTATSLREKSFYTDLIIRVVPQACCYSFDQLEEKLFRIAWIRQGITSPARKFWASVVSIQI